MRTRWRNFARASALAAVSFAAMAHVATAETIQIDPSQPAEFGVVHSTSCDACDVLQAIEAANAHLVRLELSIRSQPHSCCANTSGDWEIAVWSERDGAPDQVVGAFGTFDPGVVSTRIAVSPVPPLSLTLGQRYFVGPRAKDPVKSDGILVEVASDGVDYYAPGEIWVRGASGWTQRPSNEDLALSLQFVPEPATTELAIPVALTLFLLGRRRARR
jgi:hypothetical protein